MNGRRRSATGQRKVIQLSAESESDISKYDMEEGQDANREEGDFSGVNHAYMDETRSKKFFHI